MKCTYCQSNNAFSALQCDQCHNSLLHLFRCQDLHCQKVQEASEHCRYCNSPLTGPLSGKIMDCPSNTYYVREWLGGGGMGDVYRCIEVEKKTQRRREVAIKLNKTLTDPTQRQRFQREIKALMKLKSTHNVRVYGHVEYKEKNILIAQFMVMELLKGITLQEILERETFTLRQALKWFKQIARALDECHSQGIIHRDLKPNNIIVIHNNSDLSAIKLFDFGLSKDLTELAPGLSTSGQIVGTLWYMSPEQSRAEQLDHRSDLFSLGVILYQMLTGSLPFPAKNLFELYQEHPKGPNLGNFNLPDYIRHFLIKALAYTPEERFQSAKDCLEFLSKEGRGVTSQWLDSHSDRSDRKDSFSIPKIPKGKGILPTPILAGISIFSLLSVAIAIFFFIRSQQTLPTLEQVPIPRPIRSVKRSPKRSIATKPQPRQTRTRPSRRIPIRLTAPRKRIEPSKTPRIRAKRSSRRRRKIKKIKVFFAIQPKCSTLLLNPLKGGEPGKTRRLSAHSKRQGLWLFPKSYKITCVNPKRRLRRSFIYKLTQRQTTITIKRSWRAVKTRLFLRPWAHPTIDGFPIKKCQFGCDLRLWIGKSTIVLKRKRGKTPRFQTVHRQHLDISRTTRKITVRWKKPKPTKNPKK